ncbi:MAG: bifunctional nuclease family protein [Acidobacteriota bacterium]|nr:bifunctional nuclease family protein [Acidobacteriota bacterium]
MKIKGLFTDPISHMPIVLLEDEAGTRVLPIWIGAFEANAIALTMENVPTPRPMTHDLLKAFLIRLQIEVDRVVVTDVRNNTFFATIHCRSGERLLAFDARPSDAIALALRTASPIFVEHEVVEKSQAERRAESNEGTDALLRWMEKLGTELLGKYKM